ncbi:peptidoglycan-binding domain-containing protein [Flagellimonas algicola]|uniref:Peptidoglycan-binding protein n=1 Tax=Flagellimonas algicola TaxID=2583815 RepID=A0ABY2WR34_9FLAO|nr:peptidoglycan-binding protein [Allomuricauda algicola]TMU57466.1 peptidoglycan-binding protein [Allomuricauda algicola]
MECSNIIEAELNKGDISQSLFKGSPSKNSITDLQLVLFELGFRTELKWDNYQADGDYGNATVNAVAAFAKKNKYQSDGLSVSNKLAELLLQRHDFLPDMYILWSIYKSDLRTRKYISKGTPMSITAIQVLLNELGYGKELNFPKYGADGLYGQSTKNAMIKFANDHGITSDGDLLTRPLVNLLIKKINPYYGKKWGGFGIAKLTQ